MSVLLWPFRSIHNDTNLLVTGFDDGTFNIPFFYVLCVRDTASELLLISLLPIALLTMGISVVSPLFVLHPGSALYFPSERVRLVWRIASIASLRTLTLAFLTSAFFYSCSTWQ